jgi:hypothetical protein
MKRSMQMCPMVSVFCIDLRACRAFGRAPEAVRKALVFCTASDMEFVQPLAASAEARSYYILFCSVLFCRRFIGQPHLVSNRSGHRKCLANNSKAGHRDMEKASSSNICHGLLVKVTGLATNREAGNRDIEKASSSNISHGRTSYPGPIPSRKRH